jgi:hypothetical protein
MYWHSRKTTRLREKSAMNRVEKRPQGTFKRTLLFAAADLFTGLDHSSVGRLLHGVRGLAEVFTALQT